MKILKMLSLCGCLLLALASCSNENSMFPDVQQESVDSSSDFSQLSYILSQIVTDETAQGDAYVLCYDGEFNVLSEDEYMLSSSIADFLCSEKGPQKAPKGKGWKNGGTYKNRIDGAMKAVKKIQSKIGSDQDFELHVERNGDGTFTIWWRIV